MALIDDVVSEINSTLAANLSWLTTAYGKVQRLQRTQDGKTIKYPAVFVGGNTEDHRSLLPDGSLGNYCYFEVEKQAEYDNIDRHLRPKFKCKIVFWFDYRTIYADWALRSIEEVKAQVLAVLVAAPHSRSVQVFEIAEDADTIYQGYTHNEIGRQFLMRPYGGFAITCEVYSPLDCIISSPAVTIPMNIAQMIPFTHSLVEQVWPFEKAVGGVTIYCRTWQFTTETGVTQLTGLVVADVGMIVDYTPVKQTTNVGIAAPYHPDFGEFLGTYTVNLLYPIVVFSEITVWYTKP